MGVALGGMKIFLYCRAIFYVETISGVRALLLVFIELFSFLHISVAICLISTNIVYLISYY